MGANGVCIYILSLFNECAIFLPNSMAAIHEWSRLNMIFTSICTWGALLLLLLFFSMQLFIQETNFSFQFLSITYSIIYYYFSFSVFVLNMHIWYEFFFRFMKFTFCCVCGERRMRHAHWFLGQTHVNNKYLPG